MDGMLSSFLYERVSPANLPRQGSGILYIEDFDDTDEVPDVPAQISISAAPVFSHDDVLSAREGGRLAGLAEARQEAEALEQALQRACLQSISDKAASAQSEAALLAEQSAHDLSGAMLALLSAALPAMAARHAEPELAAIFQALLPGLRCEPALRVRVHPEDAAFAESTLVASLADGRTAVSVEADATLMRGDAVVDWRDGRATRDYAAVWDTIGRVLAPLNLPSLEDIAHGV